MKKVWRASFLYSLIHLLKSVEKYFLVGEEEILY